MGEGSQSSTGAPIDLDPSPIRAQRCGKGCLEPTPPRGSFAASGPLSSPIGKRVSSATDIAVNRLTGIRCGPREIRRARSGNAVAAAFFPEGFAADAEEGGGFALVASGVGEGLADLLLLDLDQGAWRLWSRSGG